MDRRFAKMTRPMRAQRNACVFGLGNVGYPYAEVTDAAGEAQVTERLVHRAVSRLAKSLFSAPAIALEIRT